MQTLTDDQQAILKSKFQAAASGFRARLDASTPVPIVPGDITVVQTAYQSLNKATFTNPVTAGNTIIALCTSRSPTGSGNIAGFTTIEYTPMTVPTDNRACYIQYYVVQSDTTLLTEGANSRTFFSPRVDDRIALIEVEGEYASVVAERQNVSSTTAMNCGGAVVPPADDAALVVGVAAWGPKSYVVYPTTTPDSGVVEIADNGNGPHIFAGYRIVDSPDGIASSTVAGTTSGSVQFSGITAVFVPIDNGDAEPERATWTSYDVKSVQVDKGLRLAASQAEVELVNEDLPLGWGADSIFSTNQRVRIYQWYGEVTNAVLTFTGIIDLDHSHRDVLTTRLAIRDMFAILIDQTFSASAPQAADEVGNVRTAANGVYLSMEVSDIIEDILDRAGWPTDDRDITVTSYVLDEFVIQDGASWAEAIVGDEQLTGLVGYSAWADELGVFHFAPTQISQNFTDPTPPVYTFESGIDIVALDDTTDQYDLKTRVKVRGPLTTTQLQDTWRELWRTKKIRYPVGIWYRPADSAAIRVIDRETRRMYRIRQSDRVITSSVYLGSVISHPLGLSGDPSDSTIYWVLNAPWIHGGSGGNQVVKVRFSDHHVLARYSIPSGHWSAIKVSANYIWLTNLSTDRFYKRSKTDASAIDDYRHSHAPQGNQSNPSGMMIDGTTLYVFWANGGSTARFLVCDESAPGTVTRVVKTAGTTLHGGEMDTDTHIDCYGDSDSLGLVAKFTLAEKVDITNEVYAEVVDTDLEDELGELALLELREHDTHPDDDDHPYEVRRMTLDLTVITSLAQATETAQRQLDIASQRRRVLDAGIVGNPVLQKTDLVAVVDPLTGLNTNFAIDTYRTRMDGDGTYLGTVALIPVEELEDAPDDDGDATATVLVCDASFITDLEASVQTTADSGMGSGSAATIVVPAYGGASDPSIVVAGAVFQNRFTDLFGAAPNDYITLASPWTQTGDLDGNGRHILSAVGYYLGTTPADFVVDWAGSTAAHNRLIAVTLPSAAGAPVQTATSEDTGALAWGVAPTEGNIAIMFISGYGATVPSSITDWELIGSILTLTDSDNAKIACYARCIGAGESTSILGAGANDVLRCAMEFRLNE